MRQLQKDVQHLCSKNHKTLRGSMHGHTMFIVRRLRAETALLTKSTFRLQATLAKLLKHKLTS